MMITSFVWIARFELAISASQMQRVTNSTIPRYKHLFHNRYLLQTKKFKKITEVTPLRLERRTPKLKVWCSSQLSYEVILIIKYPVKDSNYSLFSYFGFFIKLVITIVTSSPIFIFGLIRI